MRKVCTFPEKMQRSAHLVRTVADAVRRPRCRESIRRRVDSLLPAAVVTARHALNEKEDQEPHDDAAIFKTLGDERATERGSIVASVRLSEPPPSAVEDTCDGLPALNRARSYAGDRRVGCRGAEALLMMSANGL